MCIRDRRSSESRFHIPYISYLIADRNDIPLFRVKYYLTLLFLMLILEIFTEIPLVILDVYKRQLETSPDIQREITVA